MVGDGVELKPNEPPSRRRAALAGALVVGALIIAIVVGTTSDSSPSSNETSVAEAPPGCIKAWNADVYALNYGVHNSISHGYTDVQVDMPESGSEALSDDPGAGQCAVVFAANQPDPERQYAGQIHRGDRWAPLSGVLGFRELAELQRAAVDSANASLNQYGKLGDGASAD